MISREVSFYQRCSQSAPEIEFSFGRPRIGFAALETTQIQTDAFASTMDFPGNFRRSFQASIPLFNFYLGGYLGAQQQSSRDGT